MTAAVCKTVCQRLAGRIGILLAHQQVCDPDTQTVDKDHTIRIVSFFNGFRQVERGFDELPLRPATRAVKLDPRFHLLVEDFGGGNINRAASSRFGKTFRMRRFTGPCTAENKLDVCHSTCLPYRAGRDGPRSFRLCNTRAAVGKAKLPRVRATEPRMTEMEHEMSSFEWWRAFLLIPSFRVTIRGARCPTLPPNPRAAPAPPPGWRGAPKPPFLSEQLEWGAASYLDHPTEPVDAEGVEAIHEASMRVLEDVGILFLNDDALDVLAAAGCDIDRETKRVRMDRGFVTEMASRAPASFTITPRNPDREIDVGGRQFNFGQVASAPNVMDLDRGRRVGNRADYQNLLRLSQAYNCIRFNSGYPVEPIDIHASIRHLDAHYDMLTLTDRSSTPIRLDRSGSRM